MTDPTLDVPEPAAEMAAMLREIRESQRRLDTKFVQVLKGQEDAAAKELKCVRREKINTYRRNGNEEQAMFNEKVEDTLVAAQTSIG